MLRTVWKRILPLMLTICLVMTLAHTMGLATGDAETPVGDNPMAPMASGVNTKKVGKAVIDYSNVKDG